jgi:hypothetical protein
MTRPRRQHEELVRRIVTVVVLINTVFCVLIWVKAVWPIWDQWFIWALFAVSPSLFLLIFLFLFFEPRS